jgi:DNA-binding MarR family transcriptional regulator
MDSDTPGNLRAVTQRLLRRLGMLASESTPCGFAISVAHAQALMVLLVSGELSQQELGEELCIDKSNVARLCAKMVEAGHARQRPSERDGRSRLVALTPRGKKLARQVDTTTRERFAAVLYALPEGSRGQVVEVLRRLVEAVDVVLSEPALAVRAAGQP